MLICTVSGLVATDACKLDTRNVVKSGKTASFTIVSNKSQEFYLISANENVCTIFDPQGSTILSSEFKLEATTKTFAISATAPGETVIRVNAGYLPTDDGAGTYETTREIRVRVTEAATITNEDIPYTGTEDTVMYVLIAVLVLSMVFYIKFQRVNKELK